MGRSVTFYKIDLKKIGDTFSNEIQANQLLKQRILQAIKEESDDSLNFQIIFDKILKNPIQLNPQEISLLHYSTFNHHYELNEGDNINSIMLKYGFEELFCFSSRKTAETFIQEFHNHFDPLEKREFISPDYLVTKNELLDYLDWVCTLTSVFLFCEEKENSAKEYLQNSIKYKDKALIRYHYEIKKNA